MKDPSGTKRGGRSREGKGEHDQDHDREHAGPAYGLTMRPRRTLFLVLCAIFGAWLVFLLVMYKVSKEGIEKKRGNWRNCARQ
jgi:hypothetical protein